MKKLYKILKWDTNFFNFKVAKIKNNALTEITKRKDILEDLAKEKVKLVYYNSQKELELSFSSDFEINLIINRVPLERDVIKEFPFHANISFYEDDYPDESLIELAQLAGRQGRFGLDPKIPVETCDEIFKNWIINSVNKKLASHTLVYKEKSEIVGFATIDVKKGKGYTPLFAVKRKFEGKGISFALMRAIETVLKREGCHIVVGGTQKLNEKALKVYERYGLIPQRPEFIYHFWNKNL
ncbi:GNAT family N-acetyltransferase [Salegentibacter agarivorans]